MGERSPRNQCSSCWACAMCPVVAMEKDSGPPPESGKPCDWLALASGQPQASGDPQGSDDPQAGGDPKAGGGAPCGGRGGDIDEEPHYPALICIGPSTHNYVYHLWTLSPLYRCSRASDWGGSNDRLWLFHDSWSGSLP